MKFPYLAKCPRCHALIHVVGYKYKRLRPQFASHFRGKIRKNRFCLMSGLPVQEHHELIPLTADAPPLYLAIPTPPTAVEQP